MTPEDLALAYELLPPHLHKWIEYKLGDPYPTTDPTSTTKPAHKIQTERDVLDFALSEGE
jgi:hypothetical protein